MARGVGSGGTAGGQKTGGLWTTPPDVVMVGFDEPNAAENWQRLQQICPRSRLVSGVSGIQAAYTAAARMAESPYFFIVDADNHVLDAAIFETRLRPGPDTVMVWAARNPINGLEYGHGGIKLYATRLVRDARPAPGIDISTSMVGRVRSITDVASEHRFNTSSFRSWSGAFRETVKLAAFLARHPDAAVPRRVLETWCSIGAEKPFGADCIAGALAGRAFGARHFDAPEILASINQAGWLQQHYAETAGALAEA